MPPILNQDPKKPSQMYQTLQKRSVRRVNVKNLTVTNKPQESLKSSSVSILASMIARTIQGRCSSNQPIDICSKKASFCTSLTNLTMSTKKEMKYKYASLPVICIMIIRRINQIKEKNKWPWEQENTGCSPSTQSTIPWSQPVKSSNPMQYQQPPTLKWK